MIAGYGHLLIFGAAFVVAFLLATYLYPRLMLLIYRRAILVKGIDAGPIPVNALYTQPMEVFADPFAPLPPGSSGLMSRGTNRDTLYVCGWLDLSRGPLVLSVPDMAGRYYSMQFTNPSNNINFAYVGKRTTGTAAGRHLITGPGWAGTVPQGMKQVASPNKAVLIVGRVFVADENDLATAHDLARQIGLAPLPQ